MDPGHKITRRSLLGAAAAVAGASALTGCESVITSFTQDNGLAIPERLSVAHGAAIDPIFHLLSRATYGLWPGDLERVQKQGKEAWLKEQFDFENIDDGICNLRARRFESLVLDPGLAFEFKREVVRQDIIRHALLHAVYSKRQLFERMVGFWSDHLNISIDKGDCIYLKPVDDRTVIRQHALGKFPKLLRESALSPAMLVYLDGAENKKSSRGGANENYARELLELHTMGVDGGYTQADVTNVARCLTGYQLNKRASRDQVQFVSELHDDGDKLVLGKKIPAGGGAKDLDSVIEIVCNHPSTARYIAKKLVRHFVADEPPASLVKAVAADFTRTGGDIKSMLQTIFTSSEFEQNAGNKVKRPFHYIVSSLRATGADTFAHEELIEYLTKMGQGLFQYPTPDGYPEEPAPWLGTLLWRWNFAFALTTNQVPRVDVSVTKLVNALAKKDDLMHPGLLMSYFVGRDATKSELKTLDKFLSTLPAEAKASSLLAMIISSPSFMRY